VRDLPWTGRFVGGSSLPLLSDASPAVPRTRTSAAWSPAAYWGKRLLLLSVVTWVASLAIGFKTALLVLTLVGFGAAIVGLRRPVLGLLGVSMLCTLDSVSRAYLMTGGLWRWNTFNYWLLVVMLLSLPFLLRLRDLQTRLLQWFLLLLVAGLAFSADPRAGLQDVLNVLTLLGLMVYFARSEGGHEVWFWMAAVCGSLAGAGGLAFYLKQEDLPYINPNAWSFFPLTAIFAITLAFSIGGLRRGRLPLALLAAANAVWVFLSGSRGSLLITLVCLGFIALQMRKSGRSLPIVAAALLIAFGVASQFVEQKQLAVHRLNRLLDSQHSWTSRTSGRSDLALGGWHVFREHPLGIGTGGFASAWMDTNLQQRERLSGFRQGVYTPAHSGWIKVLTENGFLGILVFAGFVLSFAVTGWRRRRGGVFLLGLLVTVSLSVAFAADEFQGKGLWFLAAAVMTVLRKTPIRARRFAVGRVDPAERGRIIPPRRSARHNWLA
jgi:O-antigen ligase